MRTLSSSPRARLLASATLIVVLTLPTFFEIYRSAVFETTPRDDYAPYLLAMVGDGGRVLGSPYGYRALSVVVAIPFYYVLPTYTFTNLDVTDTTYLRATAALSAVSYVSILASSVLGFLLSRKRFAASNLASLFTGASVFVLLDFTQRTAIDPIAVALVGLLVLLSNRPTPFAAVLLVSTAFNEKIPMIFAALFVARLIWARFRGERDSFVWLPQLLTSLVGVIGYAVAVAIIGLKGNENQTNAGLLLSQVGDTIAETLTAKGIVLNLIPTLVMAFFAILSVRVTSQASSVSKVWPSDLVCVLVLVALSAAADVGVNVGRIAFYSLLIYVPPLALLIERFTQGARPNQLTAENG